MPVQFILWDGVYIHHRKYTNRAVYELSKFRFGTSQTVISGCELRLGCFEIPVVVGDENMGLGSEKWREMLRDVERWRKTSWIRRCRKSPGRVCGSGYC